MTDPNDDGTLTVGARDIRADPRIGEDGVNLTLADRIGTATA